MIRRKGFSLASIMLLTAVFAVLLAAIPAVVAHERAGKSSVNDDLMAACAACGTILGAIIGAGIGLVQIHRVRATLLGLLVGMVTGTATGALAAHPAALQVFLIGSLLVVILGFVVRYSSYRPAPP